MNSNSTGIIGEEYVETKPSIAETGFTSENNIMTNYISKWESELPDVRVEYNVQLAFASPELVCISALTSIFLHKYSGNSPARAAPEPRGPL